MDARVCLSEHLTTGPDGKLRLAPWSVPRNVVDVAALSGADTTKLRATETLPGILLIDRQVEYINDTPMDQDIRILITRRWRRWVTSNPNAVQFLDRWTYSFTEPDALDPVIPSVPTVASQSIGRVGSATDVGSNSVAEPNPGLFHHWWGTNTSEEWPGTLKPNYTFRLWYRQYVWTPGPYSDNANKNAPRHEAEAGWTRIGLWTYPTASKVVTG